MNTNEKRTNDREGRLNWASAARIERDWQHELAMIEQDVTDAINERLSPLAWLCKRT